MSCVWGVFSFINDKIIKIKLGIIIDNYKLNKKETDIINIKKLNYEQRK